MDRVELKDIKALFDKHYVVVDRKTYDSLKDQYNCGYNEGMEDAKESYKKRLKQRVEYLAYKTDPSIKDRIEYDVLVKLIESEA